MKLEFLRELVADQIPNPLNGFRNRIIEIINDRNPKSLFEKLNHGVRANETGSTCHQNRLLR
jgi:hypothetical protein